MSAKQILVVDDSQTVRVIVERILSNAGYQVDVATDGLEGLAKIKPETSLVILDVNMPELDGYGFCEKLSQLGTEYDRLPIVFLTSVESKALELLGRQYGAYLNKPVQQDELLSSIEELLAQTSATMS